jgi:hypothetical protein
MKRKRYTFWIDVGQALALKNIKVRDGMPESEQIRRALARWITAHDGPVVKRRPAARKRANTNHHVQAV